MRYPKGKHVNIDQENPEALGICDYSGFVHMRQDLVRQMEWRGNALVWTGFYVGKDYADVPNEQLRPPMLPPDPVPVQQPRLQQPSDLRFGTMSWPNAPGAVWGNLPVSDWSAWSSNANGVPALPADQRLLELQNFNWRTAG